VSASEDPQRIGWIGLAKMGLPICERLAMRGFDVTALTRNQEGRDRVARANLREASSVRGVVDGAQIVVSAISDDAAPADIVFQDSGPKETLNLAQIFVEISTISPNASRRVAETMSGIGVNYVRSPLSGSTALAAQGALTPILSGPPEAIERFAGFYQAFTRKAFVVGEAEEARYLKLVRNTVVGETSALLAEALAIGRTAAAMMDALCRRRSLHRAANSTKRRSRTAAVISTSSCSSIRRPESRASRRMERDRPELDRMASMKEATASEITPRSDAPPPPAGRRA
jgi:3-hydroxyisobutyrate dehydrogenase-like beta-hydroxyacid dehydrogenase